jgi:hypothetical protein
METPLGVFHWSNVKLLPVDVTLLVKLWLGDGQNTSSVLKAIEG